MGTVNGSNPSDVLSEGSELYPVVLAFRTTRNGVLVNPVTVRFARNFVNDSVCLPYSHFRGLVNLRLVRTVGLTLGDLSDVDIRDGHLFADESDSPDRYTRWVWYQRAGEVALDVLSQQDVPIEVILAP